MFYIHTRNNDIQVLEKPREIIVNYQNGLIDIQNLYVRYENYDGISGSTRLKDLFNIYTDNGVNQITFQNPINSKWNQNKMLSNTTPITWKVKDIYYIPSPYVADNHPRLYKFELDNIDDMREIIMSAPKGTPLVIDENSIEPLFI